MAMGQSDIKRIIEAIFREAFSELSEETFDFHKDQEEFEDWDSFSHMALAEEIQKRFGIEIDIEEVIELDSPIKFCEFISHKINNHELA